MKLWSKFILFDSCNSRLRASVTPCLELKSKDQLMCTDSHQISLSRKHLPSVAFPEM